MKLDEMLNALVAPYESAIAILCTIPGVVRSEKQKEKALKRAAKLSIAQGIIQASDISGISLLCTIPGVNRVTAITIISEIGTDMSQFVNSKRLCCWAGLTPSNNESAGKKKSVRITRAGIYLKPALVQVAHAAVKSDKAPYYKIKYERLCKRRGKKRALIAIARMILTAIYNMFVTGDEWNPSDLY